MIRNYDSRNPMSDNCSGVSCCGFRNSCCLSLLRKNCCHNLKNYSYNCFLKMVCYRSYSSLTFSQFCCCEPMKKKGATRMSCAQLMPAAMPKNVTRKNVRLKLRVTLLGVNCV